MDRGLTVGKKGRESMYQFPYMRKKEIGTTTCKCEDIDRISVRIRKIKQGVQLPEFTDPLV